MMEGKSRLLQAGGSQPSQGTCGIHVYVHTRLKQPSWEVLLIPNPTTPEALRQEDHKFMDYPRLQNEFRVERPSLKMKNRGRGDGSESKRSSWTSTKDLNLSPQNLDKKLSMWPRKMLQLLKVPAALPEDPALIPMVAQNCNFSSLVSTHTCVHACTQTHT